MRYMVFFQDCEGEVYFPTVDAAMMYARLNAGTVIDTMSWEVVAMFIDE